MISCSYRADLGMLTIDGHAGYAPKGQDIVCAGVSALEIALASWLTVNEIPHKSVIGESETDVIRCQDERARPCFELVWQGLTAMANSYPDFVCVGGVEIPLAYKYNKHRIAHFTGRG